MPVRASDDHGVVQGEATAEDNSILIPIPCRLRISSLGDDMLVRILEQLPDVRDAVRTGAVSRRWRGLWTRVSALRFAPEPDFFTQGTAAERYITFVNDALALRAAKTAEPPEQAWARPGDEPPRAVVLPSVDAVHGWTRYAVQHGLRSFAVQLRLPARAYGHDLGLPVMLLDSLPSSAKLESMRLGLGGAAVALPAAALFASLTDLSLERIVVADQSGDLLARLLSSACCPRLLKLRLANLMLAGAGPADALSELWIERITELEYLELRTPSLRILRINTSSCDHLQALPIAAPRLEDLTCLCLYAPLSTDVVGGDSSCRAWGT